LSAWPDFSVENGWADESQLKGLNKNSCKMIFIAEFKGKK